MVISERDWFRNLLSATILVAIGTIVTKFIGFIKEMNVAHRFGCGDEVDAFLIALVIPTTAIGIIAGSYQLAIVPAIIKTREAHSEKDARELTTYSFVFALILLLTVASVLYLFQGVILDVLTSSFSENKHNITSRLYFQLILIVPIAGLALILNSILNAYQHFFLCSTIISITPITIIAALGCYKSLNPYILSSATLTGCSIELLVSGLIVLKKGYISLGINLSNNNPLLSFFKQYLPAVFSMIIMSGTVLITQTMAASYGKGSIAALSYANRIVSFPLGLLVIILSNALLPKLSQLAAVEKKSDFFSTVKILLILLFFGCTAITAIPVFMPEFLVDALFKGGRFSDQDSILVADILMFSAMQIPFYVGGLLGVRVLSALGKNSILPIMALSNLTITYFGNVYLGNLYGVIGIAMCTTLVYLVAFLIAWCYIYFLQNKV